MQIKQLVLVIILILSLISFLAPSLFAAEAEITGSSSGDASAQLIEPIRADNPGILQTNPFYFVKEWGRGIQRVFTFSPLAKLQYDFQVAADKSVELRRLEEIGLASDANLRAALLNYGDNLKSLGARLQMLDIGSISGNSKRDEILGDLVLRTLKQGQFLEELKSRHAVLKSDIESAEIYLDQILEAATTKLGA